MPLHNQPVSEQWMSSRTTLPESPILTVAKTFAPISAEAQAYVNQKSFSHRIRKNELLSTAGEPCTHFYLVRKGILRGYVKDGIKGITTWITGEGDFVSAIASFQLQQATSENVQAIEDCELTGLHYNDLQYLYENFPEANVIGRKILEKYYRDAEERAFIARLTEATSKYKHFIATKSHLLNRVPLKFIASYLGMTLETLSRIRSKLSQTKA